MKTRLKFLLLTCLLTAACTAPSLREATGQRRLIGGDRDAHSCISSAGYRWCERENACVRPWVLAADKHFEFSAETFNRYCTDQPPETLSD